MITSKTQGIHANEATYLYKSIHTLSYKTSVRMYVEQDSCCGFVNVIHN